MEIYPAVDLQGGRVARTGSGADPLAAAAAFAALGARWLHVVDLDRVFGRGENDAAVRALIGGTALRVQVSGLATPAAAEEALAWGAGRAVLAAGAAVDAPALAGLVARYGDDRIAVAVDVRDGRVAPRGGPPLGLTVDEFARRLRAAGIRIAVHTDVARDGALAGPDVPGARALAAAGFAVIASGGVASLADLRAIRAAGLAGAVVGRALHEGRFTLAEALACAAD